MIAQENLDNISSENISSQGEILSSENSSVENFSSSSDIMSQENSSISSQESSSTQIITNSGSWVENTQNSSLSQFSQNQIEENFISSSWSFENSLESSSESYSSKNDHNFSSSLISSIFSTQSTNTNFNEDWIIKIDNENIQAELKKDWEKTLEAKTNEEKTIQTNEWIILQVQKDTSFIASWDQTIKTTDLVVENKDLNLQDQSNIEKNLWQENFWAKKIEENIITKAFEFGIPTQHLEFSKPIKILVPTDLKDWEKVVFNVKHFWEDDFWTWWISTDENSACQDWQISNPTNEWVVKDWYASFFTCWASTFTYTYSNNNVWTLCSSDINCADNSTRYFTWSFSTWVQFPTWALISKLSVDIDMKMFVWTNPQWTWTTNCFPQQKSFVLISPNWTNYNLESNSFVSSQTSCPRATLTFSDSWTNLVTTSTNVGTWTFKPVNAFSTLSWTTPFWNRVLKVSDNAASNWVEIYGFKINILTNDDNITSSICPWVWWCWLWLKSDAGYTLWTSNKLTQRTDRAKWYIYKSVASNYFTWNAWAVNFNPSLSASVSSSLLTFSWTAPNWQNRTVIAVQQSNYWWQASEILWDSSIWLRNQQWNQTWKYGITRYTVSDYLGSYWNTGYDITTYEYTNASTNWTISSIKNWVTNSSIINIWTTWATLTPKNVWNWYWWNLWEIIAYPSSMSSFEKNIIYSYLAIKYWMTLPSAQNYIFPDGSTIRNASQAWTYTKDITWIAKNNSLMLNQQKSQTINNSNWIIVEDTNISNNQSLVWWNNWASTWFSNSDIPSWVLQRTTRQRLFQEKKSDLWIVSISVPTALFWSIPADQEIVLLKDNDWIFSNSSVITWNLVWSNRVFSTSISDLDYISFWLENSKNWILCISSPDSYTNSFIVSNVNQTQNDQLDYFSLQDEKKAYSWYYTTLSVSDLTFSWQTIDVSYKANWLTLLSWNSNPWVILALSTSTYTTTTWASIFIKRDPGNNSLTWTYGSKLDLKFDIPAYTLPWSYTWQIIYTLYEN